MSSKTKLIGWALVSRPVFQASPRKIIRRGEVWRMCRSRIVRTMGDEPVSKKITMEVFEWSIGAMRCCSILLINHSIHVHFSLLPQCRDEFSSHWFNVSLCVHNNQTSVRILEPAWRGNAITTQSAPNSNFLHTNWRYWCSEPEPRIACFVCSRDH